MQKKKLDKSEHLIDEKELAKILSVSRRTIQQWRYKKKGPDHYSFSRKCVRYSLPVAIKWYEQYRKSYCPRPCQGEQ